MSLERKLPRVISDSSHHHPLKYLPKTYQNLVLPQNTLLTWMNQVQLVSPNTSPAQQMKTAKKYSHQQGKDGEILLE